MNFKDLSIKQKRVMIYFIDATKELIADEGFSNLTIRKIATAAGYNSATLYNYFEDLDELLLFSSISFLKDYVRLLNKKIISSMTALERYRTIHETFDLCSLQYPEIFYNLFFGRSSKRLPSIIRQYYELFPNELEGQLPAVKTMLLEGNMYMRDTSIVHDLVAEGVIKEKNASMVANLVPRIQQTYLHEAYLHSNNIDIKKLHQEFMQSLDYIIQTANL